MAKKTFTTAYNRNTESIRDVNLVKFTAPNKVVKSLAYATDINTIYDNYVRTGKAPLNGRQPIYDENFVRYDSLIEAQKVVNEATEYFAGLPAEIKNQYGNSLTAFVKALNAGDEFLVNKGLLVKPQKENSIPDVEIPTPNPEKAVTETVNTATTD